MHRALSSDETTLLGVVRCCCYLQKCKILCFCFVTCRAHYYSFSFCKRRGTGTKTNITTDTGNKERVHPPYRKMFTFFFPNNLYAVRLSLVPVIRFSSKPLYMPLKLSKYSMVTRTNIFYCTSKFQPNHCNLINIHVHSFYIICKQFANN